MRKFCVLAAVISALSAPAFGQCPAKFVPYKVTFGTSLKEAQRTVAQHPRFLGAKMRDRKKGFALSVAREGFREELSVAAHIATADGEGDRLAAIVYAVSRRFRYRAANAPGLAATYKAAIDQFGPPSSEGAPKRKARKIKSDTAAKPKASKKKKTPTKILNYYFRGGKLVKNCNMRSAARYVSSGFKKVMAGRAAADAMQDCDCAVEVRVTSKTIGFRTEDRRSVYRIAETLRKADAATPAKTSKTKAKSAPAKVAPFD